MAEYKLPDRQKISGNVVKWVLIGLAGFAAYAYLLPFLLTVVWGTVQLIIAAAIAIVLFMIMGNATFWKRLQIILNVIGSYIFGLFIEMNPFGILNEQLDRAIKDREKLKTESERLKGQEDRLKMGLLDKDELLKDATVKLSILQSKRVGPEDYEHQLQIESTASDLANAQTYIETVTPIYSDISNLVKIVDKAYTKSGYALKDAKNKLQIQKETYDAVTTGSSAMSRALKAFSGDPEMNSTADKALEFLKKDISNKVGAIRNSIQLTNELMSERDLNDAVKVKRALNKAEGLNLDATFTVVSSQLNNPEKLRIQQPTASGNKYLNDL